MLAVKDSLPSFPQLMESLGHPEEPAPVVSISSTGTTAWRNPQPVIDEDAASDTRSTTSSRSPRASPVIPSRPPSQLRDVQRKKSRSPTGGLASKENQGRHRFAPYGGRAGGFPSINIDKANKTAEKALPTPPISQSLRRANRPQPLALAPRSNNPDIAPAPISALLRSHISRASSADIAGGLAPHTASPRISGHAAHAPRSPMNPMTPVSIPTLPPNLPISPISAQFNKETYSKREVESQPRSGTPANATVAL
ncbi:hypothetical protein DACRYDRAFT_24980 [Dacryopinax primogenitus]|uniref:Uncharacterized protein n=1 Tax=Dacryopinax primogenitus (strain DJM 731) TaxID=1858805 RepID=M5FNK4_DACPD|nr:uncharacterized protein DACRYDRAFT_24980 [Dacryopinax primogenitus]EJT97600.1 hypothetical protein DACRYDRAFT_24980 [Dacryopinax primogenitus]